MPPDHTVTRLLHAHRRGEEGAADQIFELVYDELHSIAQQQLRYRRPGQTINTTALVHEAYLKMVESSQSDWQDRAHFFAVTARAMRQILVDYARKIHALKRGGDAHRTELQPAMAVEEELSVEILDLEVALDQLQSLNPRLSELIELRFYGGLSIEEAAEVLDVSTRTVDRDWYKAKAFLHMALERDANDGSA